MSRARLRDIGELGLIRRVRDAEPGPDAGVRVGIGDDTAVLMPTPGTVLLATTDLVVEDVHFTRSSASPDDIGWKAMAVNLSDIGAMGGVPRWALVALCLPEDTDPADVDELYRGLRGAGAPHGVAIVGGDTSTSPAGWIINVTVLGEHAGTPRLRSMARPGDAVAVTGSLGRSAAGLALLGAVGPAGQGLGLADTVIDALISAHRRPIPRVAEGQWLAAESGVRAMMDCSDGLATDLGHICRESRVQVRVSLDRVPLDLATRDAARAVGADALRWAVSGGEDYELLVTLAPGAAEAIARAHGTATGIPLTVIGEVVAGAGGVTFVDAGGHTVAMPAGYEHFRGASRG